jgi:large subunit ribosomal protein L21
MKSAYAIIQLSGKQVFVSPGERITVLKIDGEIGKTIIINEALFFKANNEILVGTPKITCFVELEIIDQTRSDKIIIFKKHKRQSYKKTQGHRSDITEFVVKRMGKSEDNIIRNDVNDTLIDTLVSDTINVNVEKKSKKINVKVTEEEVIKKKIKNVEKDKKIDNNKDKE